MTSDTLAHAVTTPQPLAWATAAGHCPVVNATTRPGLEHVGKLIGIHASQGRFWPGAIEWDRFVSVCPPITSAPCVTGALIGVARLVGVVHVGFNGVGFVRMLGKSVGEPLDLHTVDRIRPWWRGPWGWLLEEAVLLPEPIPMRGAGGLWRLPTILGPDPEGRWYAAGMALEQWRKARAK